MSRVVNPDAANAAMNNRKTNCVILLVSVAAAIAGIVITAARRTCSHKRPERFETTEKPFIAIMAACAKNIGRLTNANTNSALAPHRLRRSYGRVSQNCRSPGMASA